MKVILLFIPLFLLVIGCHEKKDKFHKHNVHGEYVYRHQNDLLCIPPSPNPIQKEKYPWEHFYAGAYPRISKEFFRCKGNPLHPVITQEKEGKIRNYFRDCCGGELHGLPQKDDKEFIYPCLIELLNYTQEIANKKVIITSGHRCPTHNTYCDPSPSNYSSKHMLGAEVDFYVEGMEDKPEEIIAIIQRYYQDHPSYKEKKEYSVFQRYKKPGLNVSTPPWHNKEVFIKLYLANEGRNVDNTHSYPYIGIQVRYDRDRDTPVVFDAKQAQHYLRH